MSYCCYKDLHLPPSSLQPIGMQPAPDPVVICLQTFHYMFSAQEYAQAIQSNLIYTRVFPRLSGAFPAHAGQCRQELVLAAADAQLMIER